MWRILLLLMVLAGCASFNPLYQEVPSQIPEFKQYGLVPYKWDDGKGMWLVPCLEPVGDVLNGVYRELTVAERIVYMSEHEYSFAADCKLRNNEIVWGFKKWRLRYARE